MDWLFNSLFNFDPALESMLSDIAYKVNNQLTGLKESITQTPADVFAETWNDLIHAGTVAIIPFAICIIGFMVSVELYQLYCKNNGKLDLELVSSTALKFILPFLLITHTYDLIQLCFTLFNGMTTNFINSLADSTTIKISDLDSVMQTITDWSFFEKVGFWIELMFANIGFSLTGICITIIVYARLFHMAILWIFAPIPFATLPSGEHSTIFKNFIKSFCALLLQGAMMVLCVGIYASLIKHQTFDGTNPQVGWSLLGYSVLLIFTLFKTDRIAQRMLGTF